MYVLEQELRDQFHAAARTAELLAARREEIRAEFSGIRTLCVLGCGSSFSVARSAATLFSQHTGIPAFALAAGDLLVNFPDYRRMLSGAALLVLSRSGSTSEAVRAARRCGEELGCRILSVCAKEDTPLHPLADWELCIPWAFDEAVCQTRTVTNLYLVVLGIARIAGGEGTEDLAAAAAAAEAFCPAQEQVLAGLAEKPWTRAVVLGDSGMAGLLEEGALAFKEICRRDSNHYHLLDVRHGPMVQIGRDTLVAAVVSSGDRKLQLDLLKDVSAKTDLLLVLDCGEGQEPVPGIRISLPDCGPDELRAVFALFCLQELCFRHALVRGVDPDRPEGLDPWISL